MEDDLRDLMNRLRFATGKSLSGAPVPVTTPTSGFLGDQCLLVIQQALCRHPALVFIHKSRDDLKKTILKQLLDSLDADASSTDEVGRLVGWINETSEELEVERLSGVYCDPAEVLHDVRKSSLEELGIETLPSLSQCSIGDVSPWNVLLTLVSGPLLTFDETRYKRIEIRHSNPTPSMITDLLEIHKNVYNTTAWISLLNSSSEFPMKSIRHIWLAALFFFPTCGTLVLVYLQREMEELSKRCYLWDERDENEAKETYRACCRILNCFFRHLPLCFCVDLFRLFLKFLECYIRPDDSLLDNVFRTSLQRDIGHCPSSTDIWKKYIQWKGDRIHDTHQRRDWMRKVYARVLRTPLHGLQEVKEEYDLFLKNEYRGRPPPEGRLEERFVRAKAATSELSRLMSVVGGHSGWGTHAVDILPRSLYLPRPVRLDVSDGYDTANARVEVMRRLEMEFWMLWTSMIEREISSSAYVGMELFGYERLRFFLGMRASFFPHQTFCWINYVDFCLEQQPLLSESERQTMARDVLNKASFLLPKNFYMRIAYCDYMLRDLGDPDCAHKSMKDLLLQQRQRVLHYIKNEFFVDLDVAVDALERIALLSVNWMRWSSLDKELSNAEYVRLVARFTMHRVDFLSLVMGVIRRASRGGGDFTPRRCQRAFNTFCHFWIKLELIRNQAKSETLLILERWKDHLTMFIRSAKEKRWGLLDCGVDEYFISSCANICYSHPLAVQQVLVFMEEIKSAVIASDAFCLTEVESLVARTNGLRDTFFIAEKNVGSLSSYMLPLGLMSMRLTGATVPLQTYDHHLFSASDSWHGDHEFLLHMETVGEKKYLGGTWSRRAVEAIPDDARWAPFSATQNASLSIEGPPSGMKTSSDIEQHRPKKGKRPPNRRALVSGSVVMKGLALGIRTGDAPNVSGEALQKLEELLVVHLPSRYETDVLFADITVHTEWLLDFIEHMPAMC